MKNLLTRSKEINRKCYIGWWNQPPLTQPGYPQRLIAKAKGE